MCQKTEYRKSLRCIKDGDKVIPYRSLDDMRFGTLTIEEYDDHTLVLGANKNNGGNLIKFAKIIPYDCRVNNILTASTSILALSFTANFVFATMVMLHTLSGVLI